MKPLASNLLWVFVFLFLAPFTLAEVKFLKPAFDKRFDEQVAIFEYLRGNKTRAIEILSRDSGLALGDSQHQDRDLFRMEQIRQVLSAHLASELPVVINNALWLDIAQLRRQGGDCEGALTALYALKNVDALMDHKQRFQRVSCMLQQHGTSKALLIAAETQALEAEGSSLWLAYIYNNLAVFAQEVEAFALAQAYFKEALRHTDATEEGRALGSFLRLSLAYSYFSENRFDYAQSTFATLKEDSAWLDLGLLGFGWSAYKNNQAGLALEAWRQLVRLPFQSINVYEGYIAIPFALERQNAFSEALAAYKDAITRYQTVTTQIDELLETLTPAAIQAHVLDYKRSKRGDVDALHPLLVYAYSQPSFQDVFTTLGQADEYQSRLLELESLLLTLMEARDQKAKERAEELQQLEINEVRVAKSLERIDQQIKAASDIFVEAACKQLLSGDKVEPLCARYLAITSQSPSLSEESRKAIEQIKGLLMGVLHDENRLITRDQKQLVQLMTQYRQAGGEFQRYRYTKAIYTPQTHPDQIIIQLQSKLNRAKGLIGRLQQDAVALLMAKTKDTMAAHKAQIHLFEVQARMAAARLSEEFYQKGGQQQWR